MDMSERIGDRNALQCALGLVRIRVPEALSVSFQTTDQDFVGFVLVGICIPHGRSLEGERPADFDALAEELWPVISAIGWDGVMGESRFGEVTINLAE
jgi:hypothetical protein